MWAVSLVIADGQLIFLRVCVGSPMHGLTYSLYHPRGNKFNYVIERKEHVAAYNTYSNCVTLRCSVSLITVAAVLKQIVPAYNLEIMLIHTNTIFRRIIPQGIINFATSINLAPESSGRLFKSTLECANSSGKMC